MTEDMVSTLWAAGTKTHSGQCIHPQGEERTFWKKKGRGLTLNCDFIYSLKVDGGKAFIKGLFTELSGVLDFFP